jgi:hypothetical protein
MIKLGGLIDLKPLQEEKAFTATSKETGNVSVFKTKAARDAAIKAGSHEKRKTDKDTAVDVPGGEDKPKVNIFKKDKEEPKSQPKKDNQEGWDGKTLPKTPAFSKDGFLSDMPTNTMDIYKSGKVNSSPEAREQYFDDLEKTHDALYDWFYEEGNLHSSDVKKIMEPFRTKLTKYGLETVGSDPETEDTMDKKLSPSQNQELQDEIGKIIKKVAEMENPKQDTPKSEPKAEPSKPKLESDPQAEKVADKISKKYGITPQKMGEEDYKVAMGRAVYSALTNSNFHTEARELIAVLEDKPELAKRPEYPSISDDDYDTKMDAIRKKYASTYSERDDYSSALGRETSDAAEWDGIKSVGTLTKQLRDNGMSEFADKIESIFDKKEYMKKEGRISISNLVKENIINEGTRSQVGIIDRSGKIASAYVHYDGYPSNMKPGLKKHMKNEKDVLQLIKKGGARGIYNDKDIEYYKSGKPTKGNLKDFGGYVDAADRSGGAEYVYLYNIKDKKWYFADVYGDKKLKKLF